MDSPETQEIDLDHQESDTDWSSPARQQQQQQRPNSLGQGGRASGSHKLQAQTTTTTTLRAKRDDEARQKYETYVAALPFAAESVAEMHHKLERIVAHIVTAVEAQDFHVGVRRSFDLFFCVLACTLRSHQAHTTLDSLCFCQLSTWSHKLECWLSMHAPMKRQMRAQLALLYFNILIRPGCPPKVFSNAATMVRGHFSLLVVEHESHWLNVRTHAHTVRQLGQQQEAPRLGRPHLALEAAL